MKETLYILDAYGLIYRSYFAFISRPLTNPAGENVSALYGFFRTLHALFKEYNPNLFILAFDSRTPTFRHELYPEYKANRQKTPEDLHAQIPLIEEILTALGLSLVRQDGFEADDIIATAAERCRSEGRPCRIISSDKDLMQLVGGPVSILRPGKTGGWDALGETEVRAEWGVSPRGMLDLLALTGDASDNIPGVKGVGEKTAVKLLETWGTLEGIYENADSITGAMGEKIRAGKDMAWFSRKLIALCPDVPMDTVLENYSCRSLDTAAAARLLSLHGLPSIAKLYNPDSAGTDSTREAGPGSVSPEKQASTSRRNNGAAVFDGIPPLGQRTDETGTSALSGKYRMITSAEELATIVSEALTLKRAAFDCETTSLDPRTTALCGFSISTHTGTAVYVPLRAPVPELGEAAPVLMPEQQALNLIKPLFTTPDFMIIWHNGKFDYQVLRSHGVFEQLECRIFDTMIGAWLLDPDWQSFSLDSLGQSQLGLKGIGYSDIVGKNQTFADVPLEKAAVYAAEDADLTLRLYEYLEPRLAEQNLTALFRTMEMPVLPILADMELTGIHINRQALGTLAVELGARITEKEQEIFDTVGHSFNIASPKQLQEVLFVERKLSTGKKTKTGFSTDSSVLEDLASEDTVPGLILDYRALAKLKSTYVDTLPAMADSANRIHTSFVQTGTATGRLSSRDPNLQNIPVRDDNGRRIRSAFTAPEGSLLVSADYAQIELVILAHLSGDPALRESFTSGEDVHRKTASLIFNVGPEMVNADMRRVAKTINFGVMYGMSPFRLANELRIPRGQAASFINTYFETYAGVASFMEETKEHARSRGYVQTLMGRKRYIRGINSSNRNERDGAERIAINTPIQGSAADIVKMAMIRVEKRIHKEEPHSRLLLQVHDELILESPLDAADRVAALVREEMEATVSLAVPLRVSVETGRSWGDFH